MSLLTIVSFSNMDIYTQKGLDFKGLFVISLVLIFPLLFLIQGVICSVNSVNIINIVCAFLLSILSYITLVKIYLNDSAEVYIFLYSILWIIGYSLTYFIKRVKQ